MSCLPPPLVPPRQPFDACRYLLLDRLKLYQQQPLAGRGKNKVAHRQMLRRQQCTRFELLQVTKREVRKRYAKFKSKWDLPKMLGKDKSSFFRNASSEEIWAPK